MAKINIQNIKIKLSASKPATDKMIAVLEPRAEKIFQNAKDKLLEEFEDHPVTEEILEGSTASNISNTLNGKGNLWGFIGFPEGESPIEDFEEYLNKNIQLKDKSQGRDIKGRFKNGGDRLLFDFPVEIPTKDEISKATPLPWETTKSWLFGIERGISGFGSFIYWKMAGRSSGGLQAKSGRDKNGRFNGTGADADLRPGGFKNTKYFSDMYNRFLDRLK